MKKAKQPLKKNQPKYKLGDYLWVLSWNKEHYTDGHIMKLKIILTKETVKSYLKDKSIKVKALSSYSVTYGLSYEEYLSEEVLENEINPIAHPERYSHYSTKYRAKKRLERLMKQENKQNKKIKKKLRKTEKQKAIILAKKYKLI